MCFFAFVECGEKRPQGRRKVSRVSWSQPRAQKFVLGREKHAGFDAARAAVRPQTSAVSPHLTLSGSEVGLSG